MTRSMLFASSLVSAILLSTPVPAQGGPKERLEKSPRHHEWVAVKNGDRTVHSFLVFPEVKEKAGHYESFYLKLCHPHELLGAWVRYTVHKRPGAPPTGSLWFTLFEPDGPRAAKVTVAAPRASADDWLTIGDARIGEGSAIGSIAGEIDWDLAFETGEGPLLHLPRSWMYSGRLPRTKLLSPAPAAGYILDMSPAGAAGDFVRGRPNFDFGASTSMASVGLNVMS